MATFSFTNTEYDIVLTKDDVPCAIKIGGITEKFVPNINASKWSDECWLNIKHPDVINTEIEQFTNGKIEFSVGNNIHRYYVDKDGRLEYEIELKTKPMLNVIELDLTFPDGLMFCYQDTLENEYKKNSKNHPTLEDYLLHNTRPENVVGSYAVYWKKRNNQYKTGKFCHIYRPIATDALNSSEWLDLFIDSETKKLRITIPQKWLDEAKYPVIIDPTLGYDTVGGSNYGAADLLAGCEDDTDGSGGTVSLYHIALAAVGSSTGLKLAIAESNGSGDFSVQDVVDQVVGAASVSDDVQIAAQGAVLVASSPYALLFIVEDAGTKIKYDDIGANSSYYAFGKTYADEFVDPTAAGYSSDSWRYSIWADYAPAAAGTTISVVASDGIVLDESAGRVATYRVSASDGLALNDSDSGLVNLLASALDSIAVDDNVSALLSLLATATDSITLDDTSTRTVTYQVASVDGITLGDTSTVTFKLLVTAADGIVLDDGASITITLAASALDSIVVNDTATSLLSLLASALDGITLQDISTASLPSDITGKLSITFSTKKSTITFTIKKPSVAFAEKKPSITFTGE